MPKDNQDVTAGKELHPFSKWLAGVLMFLHHPIKTPIEYVDAIIGIKDLMKTMEELSDD